MLADSLTETFSGNSCPIELKGDKYKLSGKE
jgi:hypothetical protein